MPAIKERRLSAKARRVEKRHRAAQIHQQELIDDELHPKPSPYEHTKDIPIGNRSEFLPSACYETPTVEVSPTRRPGLVVVRKELSAHARGEGRTVLSKPNGRQKPAKNFPTPEFAFTPLPRAPTGRSRLSRASQNGWLEEFSVRRFAVGCAVGSAAASGVLLLVQTLVG